jgi:hypothetical protein
LGNVSKFIKGQTMAQKAKAELSGLTQANNQRCLTNTVGYLEITSFVEKTWP